jgi:hypothetical protein
MAQAVRFFCATNRQLLSGERRVDERFGNQRADSLSFGFFDTAIAASLGILINPTDWFQNEEIQLRRVNTNDRALLVSRILNRGRRLGESTLNPSNPDQSDEAVKALEMLKAGDESVSLIDVTPVNRTRNFHNFSLETPEFFDDLYLRLTNEEAPRTRLKYPIRTAEGTRYWVLTRGR